MDKLHTSDFEANVKLIAFANQIYIKVLSQNDKALVANLLDQSKMVIISVRDLKELIKIALADFDVTVDIVTDIEKRGCRCGKCKTNFHIFARIDSITIDEEEMKDVVPSLVKFINKKLNISLTRTYTDHLIDVEPIYAEEKGRKIKVFEEVIEEVDEE